MVLPSSRAPSQCPGLCCLFPGILPGCTPSFSSCQNCPGPRPMPRLFCPHSNILSILRKMPDVSELSSGHVIYSSPSAASHCPPGSTAKSPTLPLCLPQPPKRTLSIIHTALLPFSLCAQSPRPPCICICHSFPPGIPLPSPSFQTLHRAQPTHTQHCGEHLTWGRSESFLHPHPSPLGHEVQWTRVVTHSASALQY